MSLSELRELVMDREAWRDVIHGVTKSRTWLSDWTELNWNATLRIQHVFVWKNLVHILYEVTSLMTPSYDLYSDRK